MAKSTAGYAKHFTSGKFWTKCKGALKSAGVDVLEKALWLFYAMKRPETPAWAKVAIAGALGYFICPIDAIPDAAPVIGFTDDLGVLVAAVGTVSQYIDRDVKRQASEKLSDWDL